MVYQTHFFISISSPLVCILRYPTSPNGSPLLVLICCGAASTTHDEVFLLFLPRNTKSAEKNGCQSVAKGLDLIAAGAKGPEVVQNQILQKKKVAPEGLPWISCLLESFKMVKPNGSPNHDTKNPGPPNIKKNHKKTAVNPKKKRKETIFWKSKAKPNHLNPKFLEPQAPLS